MSRTSKDQAATSAAASDQTAPATDINASNGTMAQVVSLSQSVSGLTGKSLVDASSLNSALKTKPSATTATDSKDTKDAAKDATGLKQRAQVASDQAGSQTGIQQAAASGDQSQSGTSAQGQNANAAQMNFTNHTAAAIVSAQHTDTASAVSSASTVAGIAASAAKTMNNISSASAAVAQAAPVINTAKLIQSMGQTEMRVGMRSIEFGNISISTSTTQGLISAQISLDHGELAKTLAAQLPEMQARLSSEQAMDVRIDMNSTQTGAGTGTPGGFSNGSSADQSSGGRQQSNYGTSSYSDSSVVEKQFPVAAAATTGYGSLNARLDVRV
jgi:hypothetical protein